MKKVLIVGGSGGLGSQVSKLLSSTYDVTAVGSKDIDITDTNSCEQFFADKTYDIVINFAGLNYDSFIHKIGEHNIDKIKSMVDVNILGTVNLTSAALKKMREQNFGRIILISSVLAEKEVVGTSVYSSCKAFIDKFAKNASAENIKYGITVNTLQLGYFDGGMTYKIPENLLQPIKETIGLKRFGKIEELSSTISFLIENEYVTAANIKINGGL
jgi:NAD(P)-dependent dehydrogenase (short-subunit alcohol dehydrogenase family)